jgi:hypothetical protein
MNSPTIFDNEQLTILNTLYQAYVNGTIALSANVPQSIKVEILNADVATLNSVPIEIVPAQGANKGVQILSCAVSFNNTQGDDYQSNLQLQLIDGSSGDAISLSRADFLGGVSATYTQYLTIQQGASQLSDQLISNSSIKMSVVGGDPSPNGSPDVTLKVYVVYQVVDLS